jgi:hypothetical protein
MSRPLALSLRNRKRPSPNGNDDEGDQQTQSPSETGLQKSQQNEDEGDQHMVALQTCIPSDPGKRLVVRATGSSLSAEQSVSRT